MRGDGGGGVLEARVGGTEGEDERRLEGCGGGADGIDQAAEAGITAIVQPGGSVKDDEVIAAADEHGMAMVFTGQRQFRH